MYFDALKADYRQQCPEPDFRMENKQRLNLSEKATEILLRDAKLLGIRMDVSPGGKLSSTILNHVFRCYCEGADSSVEQGARRVREKEIRARLTKQGEKLYSRLLHLRPAYEEQVPGEPGTYIFSCSPQQADNYFSKFGPEAEILKPDWLREKFRNKYRSSLEVYGE